MALQLQFIVAYASENGGAAYEFELTLDQTTNVNTTISWQKKTRFTAFDGESGDYFGGSVDTFNDIAAIGAKNFGAVYIYAGVAHTSIPGASPSLAPTTQPTNAPTISPTVLPTIAPTTIPTSSH